MAHNALTKAFYISLWEKLMEKKILPEPMALKKWVGTNALYGASLCASLGTTEGPGALHNAILCYFSHSKWPQERDRGSFSKNYCRATFKVPVGAELCICGRLTERDCSHGLWFTSLSDMMSYESSNWPLRLLCTPIREQQCNSSITCQKDTALQ